MSDQGKTEKFTGGAPPRRGGVTLVVYGPDGTKAAVLGPMSPLTIGRERPSDICVLDPAVSREHARFTLVPERATVLVEDLGSTNGTFVNGEAISSLEVTPGSEVTLGVITVHISGVAVPGSPLADEVAFRRALEDEHKRAEIVSRSYAILAVRAPPGDSQPDWAIALREHLRPIDRHNFNLYVPGTAFVLLAETGRDSAVTIARTIAADKGRLRVGVAVYPQAAPSIDKLLDLARAASERATVENPVIVASMDVEADPDRLADEGDIIIGAAMKKVFGEARRAAKSSLCVVLQGETGTGKEVLAQYIHKHSKRDKGPFKVVNCGAIPAHLVESIFFGHEKGAFTGAAQQKRGFFEQASGGTLFLDEVGELSLEAQVTLLRTLDGHTITRVGSTEEISVDVRVIAATHRDLPAMVDKGTFREDLYYRLNQLSFQIPPLRERVDEIERLALRFLEQRKRDDGLSVCGFSAQAMAALRGHPWPGNVRELRGTVDRAAVMAAGEVIGPEDLILRPRSSGAEGGGSLKSKLDKTEREAIVAALAKAGGNQKKAGKELDLSDRHLRRRMTELGIKTPKEPKGPKDPKSPKRIKRTKRQTPPKKR